jgi:acyl-coenzyme A thioesterase 9
MRFGKVLEDLDALAGNIAFAHVQDPNLTLVTASVDRIRLSAPPNLDADQHLSGKVTFVGTSSMEIRMQCKNEQHGEDPWMEGELCVSCGGCFVSLATFSQTFQPNGVMFK